MVFENDVWNFNGVPYSGKYIDYYNSGRIQNEGMLINGKLNGRLIVYFKNGTIKSVADYKDGVLSGIKNEYYKNGRLLSSGGSAEGKPNELLGGYFINGQKAWERKFRKDTRYDTVIHYYSTGKISGIWLIKNGEPVRGKHENDLNYYSTMFTQYLLAGDLKAARKTIYKRWLMDSTSMDAHMYEGRLLLKEFRFDDAISEFDKILSVEPLDRNALVERGLARINKFKYKNGIAKPNAYLTVEDLLSIPEIELQTICSDLLKADELDPTDYYVKKKVSEPILNFCAAKTGNKQYFSNQPLKQNYLH
jgi:tetratricopeptide (TPR) repeat protein